jgi:hypothetical protein
MNIPSGPVPTITLCRELMRFDFGVVVTVHASRCSRCGSESEEAWGRSRQPDLNWPGSVLERPLLRYLAQ